MHSAFKRVQQDWKGQNTMRVDNVFRVLPLFFNTIFKE